MAPQINIKHLCNHPKPAVRPSHIKYKRSLQCVDIRNSKSLRQPPYAVLTGAFWPRPLDALGGPFLCAALSDGTGAGDFCCDAALLEPINAFWLLAFLEPAVGPLVGAADTGEFAPFSLEIGAFPFGLLKALF